MRVLVAAAAAALAGLVALAAAVALGPLAIVVTSGTSMEPGISAGDLVVTAPAGSYGVGDAVAYRSAELDTVVLHRIVAVDAGRYVLQGDNNDVADPERVTDSDVVGKQLAHVPGGGLWLGRLTSAPALAAYAFLLLAGGTATARTTRPRRQEIRAVPSRTRTPLAKALPALPPSLRPLAATAALVGVVGVAVGAASWTHAATTTAPTPGVEHSIDFSYRATVPPSAAYDSTTVTAPQPVFRRLADTVEVSYDYSGRPGTVAVDARLSASSGWSSTVQLAPQAPLEARQQGRVALDLSALERRAEAAAAATGIPTGSLTVSVVPRITLEDGSEFSPQLGLLLDELALRLPAEQDLTASMVSTSTGAAPARLSALGASVDVGLARSASLAAVVLAAALGLVVVALARRHGPVAEAERIRARHADLLLPVLPMALAPRRPVVDVPDMDALATLAQRYGLLVLHWERGGVTTYVVQDESATYRFRSWTAQPQDAAELVEVD